MLLFVTTSKHVSAQSTTIPSILPEEAWGVHSWASYRSNQVSRETCPDIKGAPLLLHWDNLEPRNGEFDFQGQIGDKLMELDQNDFYTFITVWVAFATSQVSETDTSWAFTPRWLFQNGVPLVEMEETINPLGENTRRDSPYFFDEDYKFYYYRMIDSLGNYLLNLPENLRKRILFIGAAEGSTGDEGPYKGDPVNPEYNISKEEWSQYRIQAWERYRSALTKDGILQFPIMTNANRPEQFAWMLDNLQFAIGDKGGMFSHGYHISDAQERLTEANELRNSVEARAKIYYSRGEMDAEYKVYGWSTQNIPQALYWSSIYAVNGGLNIWNLPGEACQGETYSDAIHFFNRYATQKRPDFSKVAFCALRRGLDASDTKSFPESIYGTAEKSNTQRYIDIANAFSAYGANQGDPEKAIGGGMKNRQRQDYNDVGWKILTDNYHLNLTQIDPEQTSIAWWQIDRSVYGRFARGFDVTRGMNTMFFDVDDKYFAGNRSKENGRLKVRVIYKAGDGGSWELLYHAKDGSMKSACIVKNDVDSEWLTREVFIDDALLDNGGSKGADLILQNLGNTNCRFHMIELERDLVISSNDTIEVTEVTIENPPSELLEGSTFQLSASVFPANSGDQTISWTSSNTDAVSVNEWGLITAVSLGNAEIIASSSNTLVADTFSIIVVNALSNQSPFGDTNKLIPGLIQGEDFDDGGQNISFYDTDEGLGSGLDYRPVTDVDIYNKANGSNGLTVGRTREGEWLEYTVDVTEDVYDITLFYYCNSSPGNLEVSLDGILLTTLTEIQNQGDWSIRDSLTVEGVYIPGGEDKILRLRFVNGGNFDIDAVRFSTGDRIDVTGVSMDGCLSDQLFVGNTQQLIATILPLNASRRSNSWSSSDETVARVDANGLVTALSEGIAKITVSSEEGSFTDSCEIKVLAVVPISGVSMENCPEAQVELGNDYQLAANVSPSNATNQQVIWSTYDASVAIVNSDGMVSGILEGSVIISATAPGGLSDQCVINIYKPFVAVSGVTIEGCTGTELEKGTTLQLLAQIDPSDATDQSVSWNSSDNSVAIVDENGLFTAISAGNVTVVVTSNDGNFTDECDINVTPVAVFSVEVYNCPATALNVGDDHPLGTTIAPDDAGDKTISWTSSDTAVAQVDAGGVITAMSVGNSTITATTNDGNYTDDCVVVVIDTAINKVSSDNSNLGIKAYPNPTSKTLYIECANATRIKIFNMSGQLIYSKQTSGIRSAINVSELNITGLVFVQVSSGHGVSVLKVSIIK